jgi:hypothetical protein
VSVAKKIKHKISGLSLTDTYELSVLKFIKTVNLNRILKIIKPEPSEFIYVLSFE